MNGASPPRDGKMPVNLLTGFLGSGKTTLLRELLADPRLKQTAVLINEFGEVGLDHHLLERIDEDVVLLNSGCVCCTVRGELVDALIDLDTRRAKGLIPGFDRVVIETTGLADPFPALSTLRAHPVLANHFSLDKIVVTIDAVNGEAQLSDRLEAVRQLAAADVVAITKTDLCGADTVARLRRKLAAINPSAVTILRGGGGSGASSRRRLGLAGHGRCVRGRGPLGRARPSSREREQAIIMLPADRPSRPSP